MGGKRHKKKGKKAGPPGSAKPVSPLKPGTSTTPAVGAAVGSSLFVFDRAQASHPWENALGILGTEPTEAAVQENWRMDGRVEPMREAAAMATDPFRIHPKTYGDWRKQVEAHWSTLSWQVFGDGTNLNNTIPRRHLPPHEELVHLVSFGRLIGFLLKKRRNEFVVDWQASFSSLPALPDPRDLDYLDQIWRVAQEINGLGFAEAQRLAGFLADQLGPEEPPWWAGLAGELQSYFEDEDWLGLARVLGLGHLREGETLLVFRYPVNGALTASAGRALLRPTVLEAGANPQHFPSPTASLYGFTMPLETGTGTYCRELLHPPLKGVLAARACVQPLVRLAADVLEDYDHLHDLRAEQRLRLEKEWPDPGSRAWLHRHTPAGRP